MNRNSNGCARCFEGHCSCRCGLRFVLAGQAFPRAGDSLGSETRILPIVFSAARELPLVGPSYSLEKTGIASLLCRIRKVSMCEYYGRLESKKEGGGRIRTLACCGPFVWVKL